MKTVYVLESLRNGAYYQSQKDAYEAFWNNASANMRMKHSAAIDSVLNDFDEKIAVCNKTRQGLWEGVIGRCSLTDLLEQAYEIYVAEREAGVSLFAVVKAEVDDDATSWVGYTNSHLDKQATQKLVDMYLTREIEGGRHDG